jgi:glycosidase
MKSHGYPFVAVLLCGKMLLTSLAAQAADTTAPVVDRQYASQRDLAREAVFATREADWRNGPVVYQVLVDRFAPPENLDAKRGLYPAPKVLRAWNETPHKGGYNDAVQVWSHEIDYWGGDLRSLLHRIDYLRDLHVDVVYLNPIHLAYTNHKYDAQDYFKVSPEYGTRHDVVDLAAALHGRDMRLVLDGVFNHMGRSSPWFQDALTSPGSPWRDWFFIGPQYKLGYRAWFNVANLPEVQLENPRVQQRIFGDPDSVVQSFLRDGADGWRLDVAFDIGPAILDKLTQSAHAAKSGSLVVGEIYNYPEEWSPSLDGGLNMTLSRQIYALLRGELTAPVLSRQLEQQVNDTGLDTLFKWWIVLDNHDRRRLRTELPQRWQQKIAQVLQFTLPGAPCLYYGVEIGMTGGDDPEQRGPFQWDQVTSGNQYLNWTKELLAIRREHRALRIGDFRALETSGTLAFLRRTNRVADTVLVAVNPTDTTSTELLMLRESKLMDNTKLRDLLSGSEIEVSAGTARIEMPPQSAEIYAAVIERSHEFSNYRRVQ